MQLLYISYAVEPTTRLQKICVFWKEACVSDAALVGLGLEVRVWKTDEYLRDRLPRDVIAEISHRIGPYYADIIVEPRVQHAVPSDFLPHEVNNLLSDLKPKY